MNLDRNLIVLIIFFFINHYMLFSVYWSSKVQKCKCSDIIYEKLIIGYLIVNILLIVSLLVIFLFKYKLFNKYAKIYMVGVVPFSIAYTVLTFLYLEKMTKSKCDCAKHPALPYIATVNSIITGVNAIIIIVVGLVAYLYWKK
jgi:hypothetical protein